MSSYPIETEDVTQISTCRVATTATIGPTGQLQTRTILHNIKSLRGEGVVASVQGFNETREVEWSVKLSFNLDKEGNFVIDEDFGFEGNALGNTHFITVQHSGTDVQGEGQPEEYQPLLTEPPAEEEQNESRGEEYPEEIQSHKEVEKEIPPPHYLSEKEVEDTITGMTKLYKST